MLGAFRDRQFQHQLAVAGSRFLLDFCARAVNTLSQCSAVAWELNDQQESLRLHELSVRMSHDVQKQEDPKCMKDALKILSGVRVLPTYSVFLAGWHEIHVLHCSYLCSKCFKLRSASS